MQFSAIITAVVTKFRNKRQPIGIKKERIEVFKQNPETPFLQAALTLSTEETHGVGALRPINNLSVERIAVINRGNEDLKEFKFGVTLQGDNEAIQVQAETIDRHHEVVVLPPVSLEEPQTVIDFVLKPFNRDDIYTINIHFIYEGKFEPIEVSSAHSTKFVESKFAAKQELFSVDDPKAIYNIILILTMTMLLVVIVALVYLTKGHFESVKQGYLQQQQATQPTPSPSP